MTTNIQAKKSAKVEKSSPVRPVDAAPTPAAEKKAAKAAKKIAASAPSAAPAAPVVASEKPAVKSAKKSASKKAEAVALPAVPTTKSNLSGPIRDDAGAIYFARTDLHQIEMAQMKAKNAKQAAELQQARIDAFNAEVAQKVAEARENLRKLAADFQAQADAMTSLYRDIETVYGIDMSKTSYDPLTGRIARIPA